MSLVTENEEAEAGIEDDRGGTMVFDVEPGIEEGGRVFQGAELQELALDQLGGGRFIEDHAGEGLAPERAAPECDREGKGYEK